jgi:hypothetical protein
MVCRWIAQELERTIYAIAGLPIAVRGASAGSSPEARDIRRAFARAYWRPTSCRERLELIAGLLLAPAAVPLAAFWFTVRNGPVVRRSQGKTLASQFIEQLRLYGSNGIVGPWYYILQLHRDGPMRAPTFLQRCETKRGIYALLRDEHGSPLGEKDKFAIHCAASGIRCVACELVVDRLPIDASRFPDCDLFAKPNEGCGGKGAERWDRIAPRLWSNGRLSLGDKALAGHLRAKKCRFVVQKRVEAHSRLKRLTAGALPTVRVLTCLDEEGDPELMGAVFRMSMSSNRTVDNIHAGGLACAISLEAGILGRASDLGSNARLGWCSTHPTTGATIEGVKLPFWREVREVALYAHACFSDRLFVGWDIAIDENGPIIVEGNRGPDMDLMQRFMETGFCKDHRFGELIAHHLRAGGHVPMSRPRTGAPQRSKLSGSSGSRAKAGLVSPSSTIGAQGCPRHSR